MSSVSFINQQENDKGEIDLCKELPSNDNIADGEGYNGDYRSLLRQRRRPDTTNPSASSSSNTTTTNGNEMTKNEPSSSLSPTTPPESPSILQPSDKIRMMKTFWNTCCQECGTFPSLSSIRRNRRYTSRLESYDWLEDNPYGLDDDEKNQELTEKDGPSVSPSALNVPAMAPPAIKMIIKDYIDACHLYGCGDRINAGVLTALRFSVPAIRCSGSFHDADLLALNEILLRHCNTHLSHVRRLDFSVSSKFGRLNGRKGFTSHGAYALSHVLRRSRYISEVFLQRNAVGPFGAVAIFRAVKGNPTVKCLLMRRCRVGEKGAMAFARECLGSEGCQLEEVDLSVNSIGFKGHMALEGAMEERVRRGWGVIDVDLEGNLIFQEVMNGVTHGLGVILGIVGGFVLLNRVRGKSSRHLFCCTLYSASLLVLYLSSTLFHSFFAMTTVRNIFNVLDHCAIYILIAGSYTPYLGIPFQDKPIWSVYLLAFIWLCCICGVCVEAFCQSWQHKGKFSLAMYLGMGWACMVCVPDLMEVLPQGAISFIVMGGVGYTAGVPFFIRNNNLDHSIWHLFVLAASVCHWIGVYSYVALMD